jgi:acyl-coenzyme A synthetase/AMP-(fatty) acid ligase
VTLGYLDDPERTAAAFVVPAGSDGLHYRTGDRVVRTTDGNLHYLGRMDGQVQIRGYRVELGEVEAAIRDVSGIAGAAAIAWPRSATGGEGIVAFVSSSDALDFADVRAKLEARLPPYMVPQQIRALDDLPLNPNGKIDRKALHALMEPAE